MKISTIRRILKEDLARSGGDMPKWLDALLSPLNEFINNVVTALEGNLTIKDNLSAQVFSLSFTHNVELEVNPQSKLRVFGIQILDGGGQVVTGYGITARKQNGNIGVKVQFSAAGTTASTCTLVIYF